jgi:hypothetical protein
MASYDTYTQSLSNARSMALAAFGASVKDTRGFDSNPAGLVGIRDWEFTTSTYSAVSNRGFVFQGLTFGKRFLENEAVALQYSPGSLLEFVVPSGLTITTGDSVISLDQKVSYSEVFSFGFAHKFSDKLSVGLGGRVRTEKVTDTQYRIIPRVEIDTKDYSSTGVLADLGIMWRPLSYLSLSATGRNLLSFTGSELPSDFKYFSLPEKRIAEFAARYELNPQCSIVGMSSTKGYGALGYELLIPAWSFGFRNSLYFNKAESPFAYAFSVGAGWRYEFLELDVSYLRFINQDSHSGSFTVRSFDASKINNINLNSFTRDRLVLSLKAIFGNVRESLARIEGVEMLSAVYPSSYELFAFRPIGRVKVRNVSDKPIQAKASFYIERYMDAPTETPSVYMLPGEVKEVPFNAVLNDQVKSVTKLTIREGNVYVSATPAEEYDDRFQTKVLIHGRNDWDGNVNSLRHFVTPDDPDVLRYTRDILLQFRDSLAAVPRELEQLVKARLLFNAFAGKLVYIGDPKQSGDYVQYPSETLTMRSGDCDDMTACFASLLSSVGISTAFIDVVPPQSPEKSHIYMMFDSGLDLKFGNRVSENPKRYVVRKNPKGQETIWLPIETTVITKGFDAAWSTGAQEYLEDVEITLGLIKGWVKVVDVN